MQRVVRYDFCSRVDFSSEAQLTPGVATARVVHHDRELAPGLAPAQASPRTGYVLVSAYLARDGCLTYSDGTESWVEYRSRAELERAASTFANIPQTGPHPNSLVTAETWPSVARGFVVGSPTVVQVDGVSYLKGDILLTDQELIDRMRSGKDMLSIGFECFARPTGGRHEDGTRCDAAQEALIGNHIANPDVGRAGPSCRARMDGARSVAWSEGVRMPEEKQDQLGTPVDTVAYPLPDGTTEQISTTLAAVIDQMQMQIAQLQAQVAAAESSEEPPEQAQVAAAESSEEPPEQAPAEEEEPRRRAEQTSEEEEQMSEEEPRRRDAQSISVPEAVARSYVQKRMPWVKLDELSPIEIGTLFSAAFQMPQTGLAKEPESAKFAAKVDDADRIEAQFLKDQGY